jgi:FkbM family methyltransferase
LTTGPIEFSEGLPGVTVYTPDADYGSMREKVFGGIPGHVNSEKFLLAVACSFINKGDVVVDAGANHGQHSRVFAKLVGLDGEIHCIEADPSLSRNLQEAAEQSTYQFFIYNLALSDGKANSAMFFQHKTRDQEGSLFLRESEDHYIKTTIDTASLDSIKLPKVRFIKIDVEGAEFDVLKGSINSIKRDKPLISIELTRFGNSDLNYTPLRFIGLLDEIGCDLYNISGDLITIDNWNNPDFFMNHINWVVVRESSAADFVLNKVKNLSKAFCWGATEDVPYPFHLLDYPVL